MPENKENRIVFHSKEDMMAWFMLQNLEELLEDFDDTVDFWINDLIELYHAKRYLDEWLFLKKWGKEEIIQMQEKLICVPKLIGVFWWTIKSKNIVEMIINLEDEYLHTFWEITNNSDIYKWIEISIFSKIIVTYEYQLQYILKQRKIVAYFSTEIRDYLLNNPELSTELLLSEYEEEHNYGKPNYYFPEDLTIKDKEEIIWKYLDLLAPNPNYIGLIVNASILKFSPKTKLKAKKRAEEINEEILNEWHTFEWWIEVGFSKIQDELLEVTYKDNKACYIYSVKFFDWIGLSKSFFVFSDVFLFLESWIISLISKISELWISEKFLWLRSKSEYIIGTTFRHKEMLSYVQIIMFSEYLKNERNITIEELIQDFVSSVINAKLSWLNFRLQIPNETASDFEKIRILSPEIDALLKQWKLFYEDWQIDYELLEIDSHPFSFSMIPSKIEKKYIYPSWRITQNLEYYFFSDQSGLFYLESFGNKHKNLYELLIKENVLFDDFHDYQKRDFDILIREGYLEINTAWCLWITDITKIQIIGLIFKDWVISYWHQKEQVRDKIDSMLQDGLLLSENTLFSKSEADYLSYYLNKQWWFMNGHDLRNKYLHGSNNTSEKTHESDYVILVRILIIVLLKMYDDIMLYESFSMQE